MGLYIGATGLNEIDDLIASSIEDVSNILVDRIIIEDIHGSNYTDKVGIYGSNYTDKVGIYGSNYTDKVGIYGSNYTDRQIEHTSNYVKITSNILDARIKALEGAEGSPGDISLGIPAIPSTGGVAVAAAIATITAACVGANGITAITLIDMLEDKVDLNKTQADKIGGWSSNYSDKVGIWSSNYTDLVGKYTSNYADKVGVWGSNYTDLVGIYGSNYSDKVGIWGSNYTDLVGKYTSNYADKVGVWGSNYTDLVGIYGSNYSDKVGIWSSNYTDLQVKYTSNYADKVGVWGSNYTELVGIYGSNYSDKVGIWGSNYTDLVGKYTSNYADKVGIWGSNYTDLVGIYGSNYSDKVGIWGSNYTDLVGIYGSNYTDKVGIYGSNYTDLVGIYGSNYAEKVGVWGSNYTDLVGIYGSNYAEKVGVWCSNYSDKVGIWGSNYTDLVGIYGSNYSDKVGIWGSNYTDLVGIYGSNYSDKVGIWGSNYTDLVGIYGSNYSDKVGVWGSNYTDLVGIYGSNYSDKVGVWGSNYAELQGQYTSNYVARINTDLTTASTALGVRVDDTSNYVATKQNTLTTSTLLSGFFNTTDFASLNDKIYLNKTVEPQGYYQINILGPGNLTWTSVFYNYSDRITPYNNINMYYSDGEGSVPSKYTVSGGAIRNSRIYYNHGDKIMFKNWGNSLVDVNQYGISHLYRLYKMRADFEDGWGSLGNVPTPYTPTDTGYYKQFTWNGGINQITDWRERSAWENTIPHPSTPLPGYPSIGAYNDQLAYTLQSGWKYMLVRMVNGTFCDTPLIIHVNDPYYYPELSYIPPPTTLSALQPVRNKRSIPLSKQVGSYDPTPNTETTSSASLDYELTTGFNYDETSNLISVFDGDYNNLTNKPSLITTTDINHTSNYVSRINSDLTTAIGNKQNTLTSTSLATLLNTTTDFVINGSKIDLSQNTSNYVSRINSTLTTAIGNKQDTLTSTSLATLLNTNTDFVINGSKIDLSKNTSNYVLRLDGHTSNYVARIAATSSASYWSLVPSTTNISYSAGNVGIGTSPTNKLHIYDETTNETKLVIQNNTSIVAGGLPTLITIEGATGDVIGTSDRFILFPYSGTGATKDYSFTTTEILLCDILVIGGGGGGGKRCGGGGGAGTLLYHKNITLNGTYNIKVGKGGAGNTAGITNGGNASDGNFSQFIRNDGGQNYYAVGGGRGTSGGFSYANTNGGQGFLYDANLTLASGNIFNSVVVSVSNKQYVNILTSPEGCRGNIGGIQVTNFKGGGGGGAGGVGMNHDAEASVNDGYGGLGLAVDITGTSIVYAGGGNGSDFDGTLSQVFNPTYNTIQLRGGGGYGSDNGVPQNGLDGTGGGGGGQGNDTTGSAKGGDGIIIIRYRKLASTSSSLELVRGTTTDGSVDYSVGNYDGSFKIKSVNAGTPTDRLTISSAGNVDISGSVNIPTGSTYKINGVDISTTFIPTSANTIGIFNSSQFENVSSVIQIKSSWKPSGAVLADTSTKLATTRTISGVDFDGTANINIDYFGLNNKPITLIPSTTNFQVGTGYNLIVGSVTTTPIERLHIGGNVRATGNITADTNLAVSGTGTITGTSTLTGRVGIGKAPHATYACDVNGTLNATNIAISGTDTFSVAGTSQFTGAMGIGGSPSGLYKLNVVGDINISSGSAYRINGSAITNTWLPGTPTNSIYYSVGNVGIGTATIQSSYKLQVQGSSYVANTLVFNDNYRGGGADYACNKISLFGGGNTPTTTTNYGFGVASYTVEYFAGGGGSGNHKWYYGGNGGTSYGTVGMTLTNNNLSVAGNMSVSGTINDVNSSDWLRKSECVLYIAATSRTSSTMFGTTLYTSVYHIPVNLIRSEYSRPQIQWRLRMAFSSGTSSANSLYSYGFFKVIYDQNRGSFSQSIEEPNSGDFTLSTNFDGLGNSRVIITIVSQNTPTHINVNIA